MKPFDLEAAKHGEPLVTRDGRQAKFIAHVPEADKNYRVVAMVEGVRCVSSFAEDGRLRIDGDDNKMDLFMAPKKRTVYVNFYNDGEAAWHDTEMVAKNCADKYTIASAIPVEIEA